MQNIAQNLRNLRKIYDINQIDVSNALGVKASSYRNWENARSMPSLQVLCEIAKMFKVSLNTLLGVEINREGSYTVSSPNDYNKNLYGESKITELDVYEKQLIMQIRRLTNDDKRKVGQCISELLKNQNEEE